MDLVWRGEISGPVLDIRYKTGEHPLYFAAEEFGVWGFDSSPRVVRKAQEKAAARV